MCYNMRMKPEAKLWVSLANDDFQNAALLWENHRYGATIFFSQQAVEKILKAYVIEYCDRVPTKTHRIERLLEEAKLVLDFEPVVDIAELSKAYIRVRYPDLNQSYYRRREKVEPLFLVAKKVYIWVKNKFTK